MTTAHRSWSANWRWQDGSLDSAFISERPDGWHMSGTRGDVNYDLSVNSAFECQLLHVSTADKSLTLNRTAAGWTDTVGSLIPNSAAAIDLDLSCTALTNTLPIRRLIAAGHKGANLTVLLIDASNLTTTIVEQSYELTKDGWAYHNHSSGFSAFLMVDNEGLVTEYPGVCTREDPGR